MRSPRLVCCVTNAMRRRHFKSYTLAGDYSLMMFFAYIIKHKEELIMARFTGSIWKKSRRLGISLTGTGKELERRPYPPGQHGPTQRIKLDRKSIRLNSIHDSISYAA